MPGDERTDEELAADYRASGDVRCLDTLVRRHIANVRAMIQRRIEVETNAVLMVAAIIPAIDN